MDRAVVVVGAGRAVRRVKGRAGMVRVVVLVAGTVAVAAGGMVPGAGAVTGPRAPSVRVSASSPS